MNFRSFILASAAVLATAGAVKAADLAVAEPVDYMKVCDAAGSGYFYAPGTETCIKLSGYVRSDAIWDETSNVDQEKWKAKTRARFNVQTWSSTDMGALTSYIRFQTDSDAGTFLVDKAWMALGGFTAGYNQSFYDYQGGDGGYKLFDNSGYRSDFTTDQIGYNFKADAFTAGIALEQERNWLTTSYSVGEQSTDIRPDVIGYVGYTAGALDLKVSGAFVDDTDGWNSTDGETGFAVQLGGQIKLDQIAKGDGIRFVVAYGDNALSYTGLNKAFSYSKYGDEAWSALISARHYFAPNVVSAATLGYGEATAWNPAAEDGQAWQGVLGLNYAPVKNLWIGGELAYFKNNTKDNEDWVTALFRVQRDFP
jgi:hypothetical protein